ncbi:MAG: peptide deformylase [Cyanobacteria bacterium]|nr:peptide deformylase [Cyanobacteriota bacterium]MDA0865720.1 peptide deformylase [Cyanobacteriota bacterium]
MAAAALPGEPRPVIQLGDPRLRQVAVPVQDFDDRLQALIDDLIWTAEQTHGVGIAAPQVGESLRVLIVASRPNPRYPDAPLMAPTAMVNPRIVAHDEVMLDGWEGCLSVPDQRGQVPRYRTVEVDYCDRHGTWKRQVLTDFVARIFQHEHDHLEGHVFLDRVPVGRTVLSEAEYWTYVAPASSP